VPAIASASPRETAKPRRSPCRGCRWSRCRNAAVTSGHEEGRPGPWSITSTAGGPESPPTMTVGGAPGGLRWRTLRIPSMRTWWVRDWVCDGDTVWPGPQLRPRQPRSVRVPIARCTTSARSTWSLVGAIDPAAFAPATGGAQALADRQPQRHVDLVRGVRTSAAQRRSVSYVHGPAAGGPGAGDGRRVVPSPSRPRCARWRYRTDPPLPRPINRRRSPQQAPSPLDASERAKCRN